MEMEMVMEERDLTNKLDGHRPFEMVEGWIYKGTPTGDFFKYKGQIYYRSAFNNLIEPITPMEEVRFITHKESSLHLEERLKAHE